MDSFPFFGYTLTRITMLEPTQPFTVLSEEVMVPGNLSAILGV